MPLRLAILILSASAIAYEVLLIRLFSIIQWQQFAAMVISLALLGYGASGSVLALTRARWLEGRDLRPGQALVVSAAAFAPLSVGAFLTAQWLPFNPLALIWDPQQLVWLLLVYLVLALPFFCVGISIGLALSVWRSEIPSLYRADLLGAGSGAGAVLLALWVLPPEQCLVMVATGGFLAAAAASCDPRVPIRRRTTLLLLAGAVLFPISLWNGISLRQSEYKSLRKALLVPDSEVVAQRSSPLGLLTVIRSPTIPLRHAPGLSLAHAGDLPEQLGIFEDGEGPAAVNRRHPGDAPLGFLERQLSSLAYQFSEGPRVLAVGLGGGGGVLRALGQGADTVTVVEHNPQLLALWRDELSEFSAHLVDDPRVDVVVGDVRSFLAARQELWDVIELTDLQSLSVSSGGVGAAGVSYLYTVEAFATLIEHLGPGGVFGITRWLRLPPRDSLKLFATAWEALERVGGGDPGASLAVVRSWNVVTLLVKRGGWSDSELAVLRAWCESRWFDIVFLPGLSPGEANRFNRLEEPLLYQAAISLQGAEREDFLQDYKFQIRPAFDDRPFFSHFFRWRALPELLELRDRGGASLVEWGYLVAVGTLVQAVLAGSILILLPLVMKGRYDEGGAGAVWAWIYFGALGLGFLLLEIAYIQRVTLYVGDPIFAVAVALAAFLVFAGLGSGSVDWLIVRFAGRRPTIVVWVLAAVVLLCVAHLGLTPMIFRSTLALALGWKILVSVLVVAPLAFAMGMPFPLGLQRLGSTHPEWIPWAWGINGWATVVGAALAPLVAIHFGLSSLVVVAATCYGLAGMAFRSVGDRARVP